MKITRKKNTIKSDEYIRNTRFCVECGEELNNYSLRPGESAEEAHRRFHNCIKTGKFKGDVCSRLFIEEYDENSTPDDLQKNINFPEDEET